MRAIALAAVLLLALVPATPTAQAASHTVSAGNFFWSPAGTLSIGVGDSVTFLNATAGTPHSWVRDDNADSCSLPCTRTFSTPATIPYHCGVHLGMRATLQVGIPITVTIATPSPGASVTGLVQVTGSASHPTDAITQVRVRFDELTQVTATITGSGTSVTWSATLDSTSLSEGPHVIHVQASGAAISTVASVSVVVDNPDVIDLMINSISAPGAATSSSSVTVSVRNGGNVPSGAFTLRAEYLYQGEWRFIGEVASSLNPGQTRTHTVTWSRTVPLVGGFTVRAVADPQQAILDADRANNAAQTRAGWFHASVPGTDPLDPV